MNSVDDTNQIFAATAQSALLSEKPAKRQAYPANKNKINCKNCPKVFLEGRDYNRHRKTHDRPYHCRLCPKKFALRHDLDRHGAQHEDETGRFSCLWPNCRFRGAVRTDNLLKHMNKKHLQGNRLDIVDEDQDKRKNEVLRLYKEATKHEKVLITQRAAKLTLLEAVASNEEFTVRQVLDGWSESELKGGAGQAGLSQAILWAAKAGEEEIVSLLVERGANPNSQATRGKTPLIRAASNGQEAVLRVLLEAGANIDVQSRCGGTALHDAARNGHEAALRVLLEAGANIDSELNYGGTALHEAAMNGHEAALRVLLEAGANIDSKSISGRTALHDAAMNGHGAALRVLLEVGWTSI